jgi:3-O-methylgallate 3,4-dioxygenase
MAQIALGIGTSHAPQLSTPPEEWGQRARADQQNPALAFQSRDYSFDKLKLLRKAGLAGECDLELQRERHRRSRAAIGELGRLVRDSGVDALVIVSSDHKETFGDDLLPQFAVYWGDTVRHEPFTREQLDAMPPGLAIAEVANVPAESTTRPCHSELALHLIRAVSDAGFDPGASRELPAGRYGHHGIPHGWGFVLQQLLGGLSQIPVVPVFVNTFWEPNPPGARRCYDFGVAVGAALRSFPQDIRVGLVASGGLSHFVIDEELDRDFLKALAGSDGDFMAALPASLLRSGTSELRNWIVVGGATAGTRLTARVVDYLPCYRSDAGTGCGMAFVAWEPPQGSAGPGG